MIPPEVDVLIVGARCAGASLATYLARSGKSVIVLDKDTLPSDYVLSTHTIHPPGIDVLDELGVGKAIRENTPPSPHICMIKDNIRADFTFKGDRADYCPRRYRLDGLLQNAAREAGANLIDRCRLTELIKNNKRVIGVKTLKNGKETAFRAKWVVGADGRHSTLARLVKAREYLAYDSPRAMFWSYWNTPAEWKTSAKYDFDMYLTHNGPMIRVIFQTDNNQLLIGSLPPYALANEWRKDPLAYLKADLAKDSIIGPLLKGKEPAEKVRFTLKEKYFFRKPIGPGWALVGDAGHHKEFVLGDGITEALLQARSLSKALIADTDKALQKWWRKRDLEALPLYFFGQEEGAPGITTSMQHLMFSHLAERPPLRRQMARVFEHQLSPYEIIPFPRMLRWTLNSILKGNVKLIPEFVTMGKRASRIGKEIKIRHKKLEELDQATA